MFSYPRLIVSTIIFVYVFYFEMAQAQDTTSLSLSSKMDALTKVVDKLTAIVNSQNTRILELEKENQKLKLARVETTVASTAVERNISTFNPEIGAVGDITGQLTEDDEDSEGNDKISLRHLELVVGHDIDPYSRFDSTIAFSDFEEVHLEEAYITHWGLPWGVRVKLGRFFPRVGKASALHLDQLDTVDQSLMVQEYFGHEGLIRSGVEFSNFIPTFYENLVQEVSLGILEGGAGEGGTIFGETRRRPTFYAHLKNFWDISDSSNFEIGGTYLLGSSDDDSSYEVNVFGGDATFIHYFNAVNRLKLQNEIYFQDRDEASSVDGQHHHDEKKEEKELQLFNKNPFGFYNLIDYRLSPRFGIGARFDYVEPINFSEGERREDLGYSGYFTYYQSEFARWRLQYQYLDLGVGENDNRFTLQATVAIGVHKHQLQ